MGGDGERKKNEEKGVKPLNTHTEREKERSLV